MPADRDSFDPSPLVDEVFDIEPPLPRRSGATTGRPSTRSSAGGLWRPLSLVGAAVLAAVLVGVLSAQPTPSVGPAVVLATDAVTAAPTPIPASPPVEAPSAMTTLGPDWQTRIDLPIAALSPDLARTTSMAGAVPSEPGPSASTPGSSVGPFMYFPGATAQSIAVLDIGRGTTLPLSAPVKTGENIAATVTDGRWLAIEIMTDQQCAPSTPWRILVARLGPDGLAVSGAKGFTEIARGVATGRALEGANCPQSLGPQIALVAGRIAWVQERDGGRRSTVEIRSLDGAGRPRTFSAAQHVVELALSSQAVAWVESSDPLAWPFQGSGGPSGVRPDWVVMVAGFSDRASHQLTSLPDGTTKPAAPVPLIALDGTAVVATELEPDTAGSAVVRADETGRTMIDSGSAQHACAAQSAEGGVVLLTCQWRGIVMSVDGQDSPLTLPAVWTPSAGLRVFTLRVDEPTEAGWAASWSGWAILAGRQSWTAVPLRDLAELGSRG